MITLILVSVIAAVMFHRKAKEKGYRSPRFWMYPLIVGNGLLLFSTAIKWIVTGLALPADSPLQKMYGPVVDLLSMVVFLIVIGKAWKQIQQLPPFEQSEPDYKPNNS